MSKISLTNLVNLQNETTAVNAINANNAALVTALDNTVSRDGTIPNTMSASLDMNSNNILNLPYPGSDTSPVRLKDLTTGISTTNALTGSSGHTVPFLDGSNTFSGTDIFSGSVYFKSGRPWADVRGYGAVGDGSTNDTSACQAAISAVEALGGGIVYFPPGNYSVPGGLTSAVNVRAVGAGRTATYVQAWHTDVVVWTLTSGGQNSLENMTIFGKGTNNDTGSFGASLPAVVMSSSGGYLRDLTIWGGSSPLDIRSIDALINNVDASQAYGSAVITSTGSNWWYHNKFDMTGSVATVTPITNQPYPNWAALTGYLQGQVVINGGYAMLCVTGGTSAAAPPTLKNYLVAINDGSAVWNLLGASALNGIIFNTGSGENHLMQVDLTGHAYTASAVMLSTSTDAFTNFDGCVLSAPISIQQGKWCTLTNCTLGATVDVSAGYPGKFTLANNCTAGAAIPVHISAGVSNFIIANNFLNSTITVDAGASNHYIISNNVGVVVADGGVGANKTVSGNVA